MFCSTENDNPRINCSRNLKYQFCFNFITPENSGHMTKDFFTGKVQLGSKVYEKKFFLSKIKNKYTIAYSSFYSERFFCPNCM